MGFLAGMMVGLIGCGLYYHNMTLIFIPLVLLCVLVIIAASSD